VEYGFESSHLLDNLFTVCITFLGVLIGLLVSHYFLSNKNYQIYQKQNRDYFGSSGFEKFMKSIPPSKFNKTGTWVIKTFYALFIRLVLESAIEVAMVSIIDFKFNFGNLKTLTFSEILSLVACCAFYVAITYIVVKTILLKPGTHFNNELYT